MLTVAIDPEIVQVGGLEIISLGSPVINIFHRGYRASYILYLPSIITQGYRKQ